MTDREERQHVIEVLKQMRLDYEDFWEENDTEEIKAFNYAIASIETDLKYDLLYEQESNCSEIPTGSTTKDYLGVDCISRRAVIEEMEKRHAKGDYITKGFISSLPSVTPQEPKIGHWMGDSYGYICSNCEHSLNDLAQSMDYISFSKPKYCPNCGARMIEPQESEDKECQ